MNKGSYIIDESFMQNYAGPDLLVMHPLPRTGEIDLAVDTDSRIAHFRQMQNGMFVRMALLALILGKV